MVYVHAVNYGIIEENESKLAAKDLEDWVSCIQKQHEQGKTYIIITAVMLLPQMLGVIF